jgi:hypothetical protein
LEKRDIEKMNKDTVLERRSKRYTDRLQNIKMRMNELIRVMRLAAFTDKCRERIEFNILPPSNSYIGKRFKNPKNREAFIKSSIPSLSGEKKINIARAEIKLTRGPAKQRIISFLYEQSIGLDESDAPNIPSLSS